MLKLFYLSFIQLEVEINNVRKRFITASNPCPFHEPVLEKVHSYVFATGSLDMSRPK